jgi:putative DNA primase/helicase
MDRQGHEADRGFYLECWNGNNDYAYDRIGRGTILLKALCLSLFGTIQPGPLSRYLRASVSGDEADGFVPRLQVMVYPDPPKKFVNVDEWPDSRAKDEAYTVFERLAGLDPALLGAEQDKDTGLYFLRFSDDAQELFDEWRTDLERRLRGGSESPLMTCHLSKYRSLMPSLALLFHLVESVGARSSRRCP